VVTISGKKHWLWRAVDQDGYVLDEVVQTRRDTKAAKRLLKRLLRKQGCPPRRMITDKLGSYAAARRQVMPDVEHRSHKGLNNRAENSHLPFRRRERAMQGFRVPRYLQRFVRQCLLCRPQYFRSTSLQPLLPCHPSPPPQRHGGMESCGQQCCLNSSGDQIGVKCACWQLT
jgi:putative transposase